MADNTEQNGGADLGSDADAAGLATIATALANAGLVPEGDYDIAAAAVGVIEGRAQIEAELQEANISITSLKRSLSAQKTQTTKARNAAAAAEERARSPDDEARTLPADKPVIGRDDREDLLKLLGDAEELDIVAFSGETEILSLAPLKVNGPSAFRNAGDGLVLAHDRWLVRGPGYGEAPIVLTSWGLYADGELVAWRERPAGQLTIAAGSSYEISHDVIF